MLFQLIATGLLAYGVATSSVNVNNGYSNNNSNFNIDNSLNALNEVSYGNLIGSYNFKEFFDFSNIDRRVSDVFVYFTDSYELIAPFSYGSFVGYLNYISFEVDYFADTDFATSIFVYFEYFDPTNNAINNINLTIDNLDSVTDLGAYGYVMFSVFNSIIVDVDTLLIFDSLFTHEDNTYITSYTGYYSRLSGGALLSNQQYVILGNLTIDNRLVYDLVFYSNNNTNINSMSYAIWDVANSKITQVGINGLNFNYIYMSNVKMSRSTFNTLNGSIGVFQYIAPVEPSNFEDLLFGIADSQLYFLASLLNFDMLGINLYIALSGLITLGIVIFIIRKIW